MAYLKPQSPLFIGENHIYPLTTVDQVIKEDGTRWDGSVGVTSVNGSEGAVTITPASIGAATTSDVGACAKKPVSYSATLTTAGWSSSAPYTQTVTVSGILATDTPVVDINMSSATASNAEGLQSAWACVGRIATAANQITAYCYSEQPTVNIPLNIMVTR